MSNKNLFILPPGIYRGANREEVRATAEGLKEMDLYRLPYEQDVYVQMPGSDCTDLKGQPTPFSPHVIAIFGPYGDGQTPTAYLMNPQTGVRVSVDEWHTGLDADRLRSQQACTADAMESTRMLLIVLLATRNVIKTTKQNKLAKLGIGKKKWRSQFEYTTTISLPDEMDDDPDHPAMGGHKAPHLRRGHIRRQHYGPGRAYVKKIWVAPVFVNADPDFVNMRGAYNVVTHEHCGNPVIYDRDNATGDFNNPNNFIQA